MENQDPTAKIAHLIETKSKCKQITFRYLKEIFKQLHTVAENVVSQINGHIQNKDEDIIIEVRAISDHEFHIKMAGDLLVFIMHTNIVTLDPVHEFNKTEYVKEDPMRKYLSQINVYNFMADSFAFNRLDDPGYLIARLLVNYEKYFLIEGDKPLNFMYGHVSQKPLAESDLMILIQLVLNQSIESDLITRPFPEIRIITLGEKVRQSQILSGGYKIGFQLSDQNIS